MEANKHRVFVPAGQSYTTIYIFLLIVVPGFQSKELIIPTGLGIGDVDRSPMKHVTLDGTDE